MKQWDFSVKSKPIYQWSMICIFAIYKNWRLKNFRSIKDRMQDICKTKYAEDVNIPRSKRWRQLLRWRNAFSTRDVRSSTTSFAIYYSLMHVSCTAPIAQLVECPLRGTGGHGFDPGPRHTKVVKNGTSCPSLGTQTYGVELGLVDPVSG